MKNLHLYTFIDNDNLDSEYSLLTNKDCTNLIKDIEKFYYDFEDFETIEELVNHLQENKADTELIDYVSKQEDIESLTMSGISVFTDDILTDLNVFVPFEQHNFYY